MKSEFRKLIHAAAKLNFTYKGVTGKNHHIFEHSSGKKITASQTPGCPYAYKNALRDMQRITEGRW